MATQVQQRISNGASRSTPNASQFPDPIVTNRAPTGFDRAIPGQIWVDTSQNPQAAFVAGSVIAGVTQWIVNTIGPVNAASMTINPGDLTVTAGNVIISGPAATLTMQAGSTATLGTVLAGNTTVNDLAVGGDEVVTGDLTVNGTTTFNGPVDLINIGEFHVTTTGNAVGVISLTANGGAAETIVVRSVQGTGAAAIGLNAVAGGITLDGGLAGLAITIQASNAAGSVAIGAGTGGILIDAANGLVSIVSGTGDLDLGTDATVKNINIGTGAAVINTISVGGTGANVIAIGNTQTGGSVAIGTAMTTGTVSIGGTGLQTGNFDLAPGTGAQTVTLANGITTGNTVVNILSGVGTGGAGALHIGNNRRITTIDLGNVAPAATRVTTINGGDSAQNDTVSILDGNPSANTQTVNILSGTPTGGTSVLNLATGSGILKTVNIATGTLGNTVNIATGANSVAQVVNISNGVNTALTTVNIASGTATTGAKTINIGAGTTTQPTTINLATGAGAGLNTINIGTAAGAGGNTILMATGAAFNTVAIGSTTGASFTDLFSGTGSINIAGGATGGLVTVLPNTASVGSPTAASTQNFNVITTTFTGFTTAAAASQAFTITSSKILVTSGILVTVTSEGGTTDKLTIDGIKQAAGSIVVNVTNNGAAAVAGNILVTVWIIS